MHRPTPDLARRWAAFLLVLAFPPICAAADPAVPSPTTAPPRFVVVSGVDPEDGTVAYLETRSLVVETQREPRVIVDVTTRQLSLKDARTWTADGKELPPAEALNRLKPGLTVLLSAHGQKPDPAFLRVLKEGTLILVEPLAKGRNP